MNESEQHENVGQANVNIGNVVICRMRAQPFFFFYLFVWERIRTAIFAFRCLFYTHIQPNQDVTKPRGITVNDRLISTALEIGGNNYHFVNGFFVQQFFFSNSKLIENEFRRK